MQISNLLGLKGHRYVITGAASGMGRATSVLLSSLGAEVVLLDVNEAGLKETAAQLPNKSIIVQMDLSDSDAIRSGVERAVEQVGKLNGLAHIAGIPYIAPLKAVSREKADRIYRINQYAALELIKVFSSKKVYAGEHGSIVLISSVYGVVGSPANVAYAMTKAAIIGITKAMAMELAPRRIRVNCIAPGFVRSPMEAMNPMQNDDEYWRRLEMLHPLGLGTPQDIANGIAFLFSDMSRWMTGSVLNIDGGFTAQ